MSISGRTSRVLKQALADNQAGVEVVAALNADTNATVTPSSHVTPVAVTFTANTPATYGSPTGALTVADGATPTVVELVKYCDELRKNILDISAVLLAQGLTS